MMKTITKSERLPAVSDVIWRLFLTNTAKTFWFDTCGGDLWTVVAALGGNSGLNINASSWSPKSLFWYFCSNGIFAIFYFLFFTLIGKLLFFLFIYFSLLTLTRQMRIKIYQIYIHTLLFHYTHTLVSYSAIKISRFVHHSSSPFNDFHIFFSRITFVAMHPTPFWDANSQLNFRKSNYFRLSFVFFPLNFIRNQIRASHHCVRYTTSLGLTLRLAFASFTFQDDYRNFILS